MPDMERDVFIEDTLHYMQLNQNYESWSKEEAIRKTLLMLCSDIGAAQAFLYAIGMDIDLYEHR